MSWPWRDLSREVFAFVRRVAGSASGGPEAEARGKLALLALVVDDILSQVTEWQTSVADVLAQVQHQRVQEACAVLCSGGAEANRLGRAAADCGSGVWSMTDGRRNIKEACAGHFVCRPASRLTGP